MATEFEESLMKAVLKALRDNYKLVNDAPHGAIITDEATKQSSYFINEEGSWQVVGKIPELNQFEYTCRQFGVVFSTITVSAADPNTARSYPELIRNGGLMAAKLPLSESEAEIPKVVRAVLSNKTPSPSQTAAPANIS